MSTTEAVVGKITTIKVSKGIVELTVRAQKSNAPADIFDWEGETATVYSGQVYVPMTPIEEEADRQAREERERDHHEGMNPPPSVVPPEPERPVEWCDTGECTFFHEEMLNGKPFAVCNEQESKPILNHDAEGHWLRCKECLEAVHPYVCDLEGDQKRWEAKDIDETIFEKLCRSCVVAGNVKAHSFLDDYKGPCERCGKKDSEDGSDCYDYFRVKKQPEQAALDAQDPPEFCKRELCASFTKVGEKSDQTTLTCMWEGAMLGLETDAEGNALKHPDCLITYQPSNEVEKQEEATSQEESDPETTDVPAEQSDQDNIDRAAEEQIEKEQEEETLQDAPDPIDPSPFYCAKCLPIGREVVPMGVGLCRVCGAAPVEVWRVK